MKFVKNYIPFILLTAFIFAGCIPETSIPNQEETVKGPDDTLDPSDRFNVLNYSVDTIHTENFEGMWVMVSTDYSFDGQTVGINSGDTTKSIYGGNVRIISPLYYNDGKLEWFHHESFFHPPSNISISGSQLTSEDGTWSFTVIDTTHIEGSLSYTRENIFNDGNEDVQSTYTETMTVKMVKISDVSINFDAGPQEDAFTGTPIGSQSLTYESSTVTDDLWMFDDSEWTDGEHYENGIKVQELVMNESYVYTQGRSSLMRTFPIEGEYEAWFENGRVKQLLSVTRSTNEQTAKNTDIEFNGTDDETGLPYSSSVTLSLN